jgi:hypothetical protein
MYTDAGKQIVLRSLEKNSGPGEEILMGLTDKTRSVAASTTFRTVAPGCASRRATERGDVLEKLWGRTRSCAWMRRRASRGSATRGRSFGERRWASPESVYVAVMRALASYVRYLTVPSNFAGACGESSTPPSKTGARLTTRKDGNPRRAAADRRLRLSAGP